MQQHKRVMVGVSGGVDSSVALAQLKKTGYDVFGVFLRTWQPDWSVCTWKNERRDAMRVCAHLQVPFIEVNAEEAYKKGVADYLISEYTAGRTPNPDVMCNREVKFGHFLQWAKQHGADYVATGHYARNIFNVETGMYELHEARDLSKDQSYFLWMLGQEDLKHVLFPVGDYEKTDTRKHATKYRLPTATKKDSQGICFLGPIDMKTFLKHEIKTVPGNVLDKQGNSIGTHDGALLYTLGERHGFHIANHAIDEKPYYVIAKNVTDNTITVDHVLESLTPSTTVRLTDVHTISGKIKKGYSCDFRYRYHGERVSCTVTAYDSKKKTATIEIAQPLLIPAGQSCVFYSDSECFGGGIFAERYTPTPFIFKIKGVGVY